MGVLLHLSDVAYQRVDDEWEVFSRLVGSLIGRFDAAKAVLIEPEEEGGISEFRRRIGELHIIGCRSLDPDEMDEALATAGLKIMSDVVKGAKFRIQKPPIGGSGVL